MSDDRVAGYARLKYTSVESLIHARISLPLLPDFLVMGVISVFLTVISIVLVFFRSPEFRYVVELTMEYAGKFLNRFKAS